MICVLCVIIYASNKVVLGVIGADVMFASFFNFLLHNFDPCKETTHEYNMNLFISPWLLSVFFKLNLLNIVVWYSCVLYIDSPCIVVILRNYLFNSCIL